MKEENRIPIDREVRREVGYYSTPSYIAEFLAEEMLKLNPKSKRILDPAVGSEELLPVFHEHGITSDGYDIESYKSDYKCKFHHRDFLKSFIRNKGALVKEGYDLIILNPPFINYKYLPSKEYKIWLNENFPKVHNNIFADFLLSAIEIAREGCIIGAVLPDILLYSKSYRELRLKIFEECQITHILLCPESTFRGTGANLSACILIMTKGKAYCRKIKVLDRLSSLKEFKERLANRNFDEKNLDEIIINSGEDSVISTSLVEDIKSIIVNSKKLGERFIVSGGVSTGKDSYFTSTIRRNGFTIPFYTNPARSKFRCEPNLWLHDDFLKLGKTSKGFIARNRYLYDREGIVCSATGKRFGACCLPKEGVVRTNASIFPPAEDLYWLIAYLNSSFVTYLLKAVLTRSNLTTIGNVSSIPLPDFPDKLKRYLHDKSIGVISGELSTDIILQDIDRAIEEHLKLSEATRERIHRFCSDLSHLV